VEIVVGPIFSWGIFFPAGSMHHPSTNNEKLLAAGSLSGYRCAQIVGPKTPMTPLVLLVTMLCLNGVVVHSEQVEEAVLILPKTSAEFFALFSFSYGADETLDLLQIGKEHDAFNRWVLWSIHSVNKPHWHIKNKSHARVFDLLNWSRQEGLMPKPIDINKICHKGMEHLQKVDNAGISVPPKPNEHIPTAVWTNLWVSCHKKLSSKQRTASNCIDIPGIVVRSSNPDKSNNPCNKEYRMVDGAHRMCLRKYGLALLEGELAELQSLLAKANGLDFRKDIIDQITDKEHMIAKVSHAIFLEIDQETFGSMLIYSDNPVRHHEEWAQTMHLSQELKDEWKLWMRRVLAIVQDWKDHFPTDVTNDVENKQNDEL
jgi:hypothetical protein